MKNHKMLIETREIKKIKLFDVLLEDIHSMGNKPEPQAIEGSTGLTYHEVWEHISDGGDWYFVITEHNNPENVFMTGTSYQDMNSARKGEECVVVGHATEAEISDISKKLSMKRIEEFNK